MRDSIVGILAGVKNIQVSTDGINITLLKSVLSPLTSDRLISKGWELRAENEKALIIGSTRSRNLYQIEVFKESGAEVHVNHWYIDRNFGSPIPLLEDPEKTVVIVPGEDSKVRTLGERSHIVFNCEFSMDGGEIFNNITCSNRYIFNPVG